MTAQLARAFFDLLWLAVTWNWGQISNSDPRTKKEASAKSIPWWQCMAVAWNGTALDAREMSHRKTEKVHHAWAGRSTQTRIWTYTKSLRINASYECARA